MRIGVIGAGSAGLCMAQQALEIAGDDQVEVVVFEQNAQVGGLWRYWPDPGPCEIHAAKGHDSTVRAGYADWPDFAELVPSAMYDGLRTNIPSDLMAYRDDPFKSDTPLFPSRAQVNEYLEAFANRYGLHKHIRFETKVTSVERMRNAWLLTYKDANGEHLMSVDALVCAQGRCNAPFIPAIPHLDRFRGQQLHSAWYRTPTEFRDQRVLVVGNSSSACDITRELTGGSVRNFPGSDDWQAESKQQPPKTNVKVFQAYHNLDESPAMDYDPRDADAPDWCRRIHVVDTIADVDKDGTLLLRKGDRLPQIDTIIWATGFLIQVPFTSSGEPFISYPLVPPLGTTGVRVAPEIHAASVLDNMDDWLLFYKGAPNLVFLGLPNRIVPFPFAQLQSRAAVNVFLGRIPPLPPVRNTLPLNDPNRWVSQPAENAAKHLWRDWTMGAASEKDATTRRKAIYRKQ
ncbi:monooxygenase [Malassezia yamatoensis]|uniref:Monooxygenase n=1 Tax=Malassezia yamatoensis TaxID=253288 RepID=A0AAJ5YXU4_9BASI|nr:monooxygenase [Malassezia yamatoensis]